MYEYRQYIDRYFHCLSRMPSQYLRKSHTDHFRYLGRNISLTKCIYSNKYQKDVNVHPIQSSYISTLSDWLNHSYKYCLLPVQYPYETCTHIIALNLNISVQISNFLHLEYIFNIFLTDGCHFSQFFWSYMLFCRVQV